MSYENLFIGDFSDEQKNKIFLKEPLESNSVRFEKDGFTIKLENGVELIHRENGIVIRASKDYGEKVYKRETPDGTTQLECPKCHHEALKEWRHPHCWNCGQKLDWEDLMKYPKELYIGSGLYGGDEEIEKYTEKVVKCRKSHKCSGCQNEIQAGEEAVAESGFMDGHPVSNYICLRCVEAWLEESGQVDEVED